MINEARRQSVKSVCQHADSVTINATPGTTIYISSTNATAQNIAANAILEIESGASLTASAVLDSANIDLAGGKSREVR